jgi:NAD(P)-dependent dehydrogenase (short-subunit alcohol dehydrogenase family)
MKNQKVWFVTGAAKGFGYEIVKTALNAGHKVVATVRNNAVQLSASLNNHPNLFIVAMDVTKETEVKTGVENAVAAFGKLDVIVNNAGFGIVTAIEEASDEEVRRQYETNVFGLLNVVRAVLPVLRRQKSGHIINISSLFGYDAIPGWALYGSTKFAVEGLSKGLAAELAPFGIKVTAAAPGLFRTQFLSQESYSLSKSAIDDYSNTVVGQMKKGSDNLHGNQAGDPAKLAQVILELTELENPPLHLPIGKDSLGMYRKNAQKSGAEIEYWSDKFTPTEIDDQQ